MSQALIPPGAAGRAAPSAMDQSLAQRKIGAVLIAFFQLSAVGPLLVIAGVVVSAFAAAGLIAVPSAFGLIALVLAVWSIGYVAYARRVARPGAFYTLIGVGLGRPAGVAAGLVSLVGYNSLQVALYGLIGPQLASFLSDNTHGHLHIHPSWWQCAFAVWALTGLLGLARVDISARFLGILSITEMVVILAISVDGLLHPAGGHIALAPLNPAHLTAHSIGPLAAIAVLGFIGFELAQLWISEARDPQRTPRRATFGVLALVGVVYVTGSFAMTAFYGPSVVSVAQTSGPAMFFALAPGILASAGRCLFLTSLLAATVSYHNTVWHYLYDCACDGLFPRNLVRVGSNGIPRTASLVQSAIGLIAILVALGCNWAPTGQLFYIGGTIGALAVLGLLGATSLANLVDSYRTWRTQRSQTPEAQAAQDGEQALRDGVMVRIYAPALAAILIIPLIYAAVVNFATLIGVVQDDPVAVLLPAGLGAVAVIGVLWALALKRWSPQTYRRLAGPETRLVGPAVPVAQGV